MALPFDIIYSVVDAKGRTSTTSIKVPDTFNIADYTSFAAQMATLIDALLAGRVTGADLCLNIDISGLNFNTLFGPADVEELAAFEFDTVDGRTVNVNVPCLDEGIVLAGSDALDLANPAVANFISLMENGFAASGGTVEPCDIGEVDIVSTISAAERFRSSGSRE